MHVNIVSEFCLSRWSGLNYLNSGTKASSGKYCEYSTSMAEYSCSIVNSVPPPQQQTIRLLFLLWRKSGELGRKVKHTLAGIKHTVRNIFFKNSKVFSWNSKTSYIFQSLLVKNVYLKKLGLNFRIFFSTVYTFINSHHEKLKSQEQNVWKIIEMTCKIVN